MEKGALLSPLYRQGSHIQQSQEVREAFPGSGLDIKEAGACVLGNCGQSVQGVVE